jgi:hypothetical protein
MKVVAFQSVWRGVTAIHINGVASIKVDREYRTPTTGGICHDAFPGFSEIFLQQFP